MAPNPASPLRIAMVAAECKGLAKVGGLADVVHDLGQALRHSNVQVTVLMPAYGTIRADARHETTLEVPFGARSYLTQVLRANLGSLAVLLVDQPEFFGGEGRTVYVDSSLAGRGPFEDDARRFAFFSRACAQLLVSYAPLAYPDVVHCHDWHSGFLPLLAKLSHPFRPLGQRSRFLFTIHNLDYQGIRPLRCGPLHLMQSLESYYPDLLDDMEQHPLFSMAVDPRYSDCINPMRAGITLSDMVNTVSPSYAMEITLTDDPARNFVGGRGLEETLRSVQVAGRLTGFLNGISYEEHNPSSLDPPLHEHGRIIEAKTEHKRQLLAMLKSRFPKPPVHNGLPFTPDGWPDETTFLSRPLVVSVSRLAAQKVSLFFERNAAGDSVLDALSRMPMTTMLLGTGPLESTLASEVQAVSGPFLYLLPLFDAELANKLYVAGDFFLMPSDFEPCGISQLIAMRHAALPIASRVGGLQDTIKHRTTGFLFSGRDRKEAAEHFVETTGLATRMWLEDRTSLRVMQTNAMSQRFTWEQSASRYMELYFRLIDPD